MAGTGGKRVGAGRKKGGEMKSRIFSKMIDDTVSTEDWNAIIKKAVFLAKQGEKGARDFLTERRFGKVPDKVEGDLQVQTIVKIVRRGKTEEDG